MLKRSIFFLIIGALIGTAFLFGLLVTKQIDERSTFTLKEPPVYQAVIQDKSFFDSAYDFAETLPKSRARSAIAAHHLLVADKIASLFESIGSQWTKTVIIMSPNHFSSGQSPAQISSASWDTPYGIVSSDLRGVNKLTTHLDWLRHEELAARGEHGLGALMPFVKRSFPNARVVPMILDESLSDEHATLLGQTIKDLFPRAVVIASIDMSHNLPFEAQAFHDETTMRTIASGTRCPDDRCFNLEIDANKVLQTMFTLNEVRGTQTWTQTHHGSSLAAGATDNWKENTSHILGSFNFGAPVWDTFASLHIVGDVMLDREVRSTIERTSDEHPWKDVKRLLMGSHLRVGNLEGTIGEGPSLYTPEPPFEFKFSIESIRELKNHLDVVSLANNHIRDRSIAGEEETQSWLDKLDISWFGSWSGGAPRHDTEINGIKLSFIGYHQFAPDEASLVREIKNARDRYVIVMPHWGPEYQTEPSDEQRRLAQLMIDAGADLIVGGHPHVEQTIEIIDGVPVVYSLGNFIFDQPFPETWPALTLGVILTEDYVTLHPLPVSTEAVAPVPTDRQIDSITLKRL